MTDGRLRAQRPLLGTAASMLAIAASLAVVFGVIEAALHQVLAGTFAPSLHLAVFFVGYDIALGLVLLIVVGWRLRLDARAALGGSRTAPSTRASVLVAAYDEVGTIVSTVRTIARQNGVEIEIIVGDDGSRDDTSGALVHAFGLTPKPASTELCGVVREGASEGAQAIALTVVRLPHAGKGATLNAIAALAKHPILITLDADTVPAEGAIAKLVHAFDDPDVVCAAGVVTLRNGRQNWLTHHQHAEYLKNAVARIGWSALGALEQVPGAFTAVRADAFVAVHGFPEDSLTEDYELTYRLVDRGVRVGRVPLVVTVPGAQVFTDGPASTRGFIRQRTRWFAGFLSTLARFARLIGEPRAGAFGLLRLPLKLIDAVLPIIAFGSLFVLARAGISPIVPTSRAALMLFAMRWVWDLTFYAFTLHFSARLGDASATRALEPRLIVGWLCTATEALTYVWLKHLATLRAYLWAVRRVRTWEPSRPSWPQLQESPK